MILLHRIYSYPILFIGLALCTGCAEMPTKSSPEFFSAYNGHGEFASKPKSLKESQDDVLAMIEFCVDLDSEDDRELDGAPNFYSVRKNAIKDLEPVKDRETVETLDSRSLYAKDHGNINRHDPTQNGFPSFNNAWTLWHNKKTNQYALAFRGTVIKNWKSVAEDALVATIPAKNGVEIPRGNFLPLTFAEIPRAEIHSGFAYAVVQSLFDAKYGALPYLVRNVPKGSTLILTGHSQGAALATLAHALLFHTLHPIDGGKNPFGIPEWTLRSYVFAQPRPGNVQFALDFARVSNQGETAYVFQNTHDPVTMVPETHALVADALADALAETDGDGPINLAETGFNAIRGWIARSLQDGLSDKIERSKSRFITEYWKGEILTGNYKPEREAGSQSYMPAGNVIGLVGNSDPTQYYDYPTAKTDTFFQHHAPVYRKLIDDYFK